MPNAAQDGVWVKIEDQLHKIMDVLDPMRAVFKQVEEGKFGERMTSLEQSGVSLLKRLDDLDRRLPVGNKVYIPEYGKSAPGRQGQRALSLFIEDVARTRFGRDPQHFDRKHFRFGMVEGIARAADQTEGTTTAGGFLVPEEILPEVVALIGEVGVGRRICRVIPMTRKDMKLPTRNTGPLVYWPGEGVKPTQSNVALLRPELNSKTMLALDEISEELDMDSIIPMSALLTDLFVEAVALEEDVQVFSSTSPFSGVLNTTDVVNVAMPTGKTAQSDLAYNDVVKLKHAVDSRVVQSGSYVFHQDQVENLLKIKDNNAMPIWKDAPTGSTLAAGPAGMILGRPYYTTRAMPASGNSGAGRFFMCYGDFRFWAFGDRMQFQVDISKEAGFTTFTSFMRVAERIATVAIIPGAFARLRTANN